MSRLIFLFSIPFILNALLYSDEIYFKNGDRLTGKIIKADQNEIEMKAKVAGEVSLEWDSVEKLITDHTLYATLADGKVLSGEFALRGTVLESGVAPTITTIPLKQLRALRSEEEQHSFESMQHPGWSKFWAGSLDAGLSSVQGNSEVLTANVNANISRATRRDRTTVYFTSLFNQDSNDESSNANAIRSGIRYDYSITKRLFGFGFTDFEYDALQDLDLRNVVGGGIGRRLKKSPRFMFDIFAGGSFNQEYFSNTADRKTAELLVGEEINYKVSKHSVFDERLAFFPNMSDPGEYRSSFDLSSSTKLNHWLNWQVTVSNRLLSDPAPGTKKNDLIITTGIGINFGRANPFESPFSFVKLLTDPEKE